MLQRTCSHPSPTAFGSESRLRAGMMGARVTRVLTNFNLESRAHREISKAKTASAPRHPSATPAQDREFARTGRAALRDEPDSDRFQNEIKKKDEHLLTLLKEVYVDSKDPPMNVKNKGGGLPSKREELRLTKVSHLAHLDIQTVPKGKISVTETLTLLSNHLHNPQTWTAEKIAKEYSLELKDVTALLTFFIPFAMKIFPHPDKRLKHR
ncbi:NADH dehydrogenase [ubiquinone] 1 alpha subcomplex assembly factor 4 [Rhineura floridana]|uniref:NADH dehydrogenase [ubiquinone] 1 alpha subcomplex assembly factor 4 n=1 Tax=Rhineura floridana TaxID=261503 RepID=UPI002AC7ECB3|nr:NADH dehydrogenase [ubiquinone] 1 alpha subcomplex assembly factor 4 [Rhineura floridana]